MSMDEVDYGAWQIGRLLARCSVLPGERELSRLTVARLSLARWRVSRQYEQVGYTTM